MLLRSEMLSLVRQTQLLNVKTACHRQWVCCPQCWPLTEKIPLLCQVIRTTALAVNREKQRQVNISWALAKQTGLSVAYITFLIHLSRCFHPAGKALPTPPRTQAAFQSIWLCSYTLSHFLLYWSVYSMKRWARWREKVNYTKQSWGAILSPVSPVQSSQP